MLHGSNPRPNRCYHLENRKEKRLLVLLHFMLVLFVVKVFTKTKLFAFSLLCCNILGSIAASDFTNCDTFLRTVVCLSDCNVRARCLNRSTDLNGIWQVNVWGPTTHCGRRGFLDPKERRDLESIPSQNVQLQIAANSDPPFAKLFWSL